MAVEHQRLSAARALPETDHVGPALFDLLPLHLEAHVGEFLAHPLAHRLLVAGRARDRDEVGGETNEAVGVDLNGNAAPLPSRTTRSARGAGHPRARA